MRRVFLVSLAIFLIGGLCACGETNGKGVSPLRTMESPLREPTLSSFSFVPDPKAWVPGGPQGSRVVELTIYEPIAWTDMTVVEDRLWIANNLLEQFVILDERGEEVGALPYPKLEEQVPLTVMGLAYANGKLWVADARRKEIIELTLQGEVIKRFPIRWIPQGMTSDGESLWVVQTSGPQLDRYTFDGRLVQTVKLMGYWVTGVAWDGSRFWYVDPTLAKLWVFDPVTQSHQEQSWAGDFVGGTSFDALAFGKDCLLIFADMIGYLWMVPLPVDQQ